MVICCALCGADLSNRPPSGVFGRTEDRCPDCGFDADSDVPALAPSEEEMVYDFRDWEPRDRVALRGLLVDREIPFRWEPGPVLAVHENDVVLVEETLDQLDEAGDELDGLAVDDASDVGSEESYRAMGELFLVADRLTRGYWDGYLVETASGLEEAVGVLDPPFGVEARLWADVRRLASELRAALSTRAEEEVVVAAAAALRDRLRPLV